MIMMTFNSPNSVKSNQDRPIYFIKNGSPHSNKSDKVWEKTKQIICRKGFTYSFFETNYPGHATELTNQILQSNSDDTIIVAVGGDGTIHEVINSAAKYPHAIVVCLPAGSGNDYVRGVQMVSKLEEIMTSVGERKAPTMIDIGQLSYENQKKYFINSMGLGFDAAIAKAVNESQWKKRFQTLGLGKFVYIYFFIKMLFSFRTFSLSANIDGHIHSFRNVWFLVAANQPYFGGGIKVSPHSTVTDGKLHVIVVSGISSFLFLLVFATVTWGGHLKLKWVDSFICNSLSIDADENIPIQADGEHIGYSSITVKILPKATRVIK